MYQQGSKYKGYDFTEDLGQYYLSNKVSRSTRMRKDTTARFIYNYLRKDVEGYGMTAQQTILRSSHTRVRKDTTARTLNKNLRKSVDGF